MFGLKNCLSPFNHRTFQDLENDEVLVLALVKLIEIIGEAESRVNREYQAEHSQIPWSAMIGMRNRLVHAYFDIKNPLANNSRRFTFINRAIKHIT